MTTSETPRSGLDLRWIDDSIRPQDDLFGYVNGKWLQDHEIPADRSQDGAFRHLYDQAELDVQAIVQGSDDQQITNLFASFMNSERIEALGTLPLQPVFDAIEAVDTKAKLASLLGDLQRQQLVALFGAYVHTDAKNSSRYLLHLTQSGLGLPDESFYRGEEYAETRTAYVEHLAKLAALAGLAEPLALAALVMELESALADVSWDRVTNRDAEKTYTLTTFANLIESAPDFAWTQWASTFAGENDPFDELVVRQPSFLSKAAELWADRPLEQWKQWLTIRVVSNGAPYLNDAIVEQNFSFYGRTLSGTPELRERWKRGVGLVEDVLGDVIGQQYVKRHFPASSKARMVELVHNLIEAYRESITGLDWMSPITRQRALQKLDMFATKIGYPEEWKDYSSLRISADDLFGNVIRAGVWSTDYDLGKLGKPVDRGEWFMTPQTVNAYFNPQMNEIVFPAAILQPPFFHPEADDAANYGGIGAVIGHEIGHGFDDQGSRYDGEGNLTDWWEASDREEFERRAKGLIEQYNQLSPLGLPDNKVNGALTVGENIGDLGGLTIAIKAYNLSLDGREAPMIDGLTGLQRVLFGWAQVWRSKTRDEEALRRLAIDTHAPPDLRCNAIVANLDSFHDAFEVDVDDVLYRPVDQRVRIW